MRMHPSVAELQERACGVLRNLSSSIVESRNLAWNMDAVMAVAAALRGHPTSAEVQETALFIFTVDNARCTSRAVNAGAIEALVAAMHGHSSSAGVQERASLALYFLMKGNDENKLRARSAGAKASAEAALKTHHATEKVVTEAQDLLQQLL